MLRLNNWLLEQLTSLGKQDETAKIEKCLATCSDIVPASDISITIDLMVSLLRSGGFLSIL